MGSGCSILVAANLRQEVPRSSDLRLKGQARSPGVCGLANIKRQCATGTRSGNLSL